MPRFALLKGTIEDFVDLEPDVSLDFVSGKSKETKTREQKTDGDIGLLKPFLQRKVELSNIEKIPPDQLNELLSEFVFTVRSKDGNDCEATSRPWKRHLCLAQQF